MVNYYRFNENIFRRDVDNALKSVEKILEADRRPLLADEVHHKYENKYDLANHMTNISIVAQMNILERLGLTPQIIQQLVENTKSNKTTTLRFEANETCTFLKEQTVDVPDPNVVETVTERNSVFGSTRFKSSSSSVHKVIKKVKEYHWTIKTHWEITVFSGNEVDKKIMIQSRDASTIVITQSKDAPMEKVEKHIPVDLNLTWFLQQIDMDKKATTFTIDTSTAKTPRRNEQVEASMNFFCSRMNNWLTDVKSHFSGRLQRIISQMHNPAIPLASNSEQLALSSQCSAKDLFGPILPLLEEQQGGNSTSEDDDDKVVIVDGGHDPETLQSDSTLALPGKTNNEVAEYKKQQSKMLSQNDTIQLLNAQVQSIDTKLKSLNEAFPASHQMGLFSIAEATLFLLLDHSQHLCLQYQHAIGYLESMLEKQLISAIGKRVTNEDLEEFVRFHNAKFLAIPPRPFCHAIGRPNRFPYGVLSIESKQGGNNNTTPIETMVRPVLMSAPLEVPLNAATTLQLTGNTYLHGWMHHRSERGECSSKSFQLSARARQFSSFLLVIGTMAGPNKLNPKDAIILQNKDEVLIPLLLEEIPSAKEFRDAIESLSPEQQRFAKSFRGMQLESSVFGVAVIQIKPQLEALLGLPEDSLAKEIKLTEDLMDLFVKYQVPSDLLSYDELSGTMGPKERVESVRQNVKAVLDVIEGQKEKQLEDKTMQADMAAATWSKEEPMYDWSGSPPTPSIAMEPNYGCNVMAMPMTASATLGGAPPPPGRIGGGGGRGGPPRGPPPPAFRAMAMAPPKRGSVASQNSARSRRAAPKPARPQAQLAQQSLKPIEKVEPKSQPSTFDGSFEKEASPSQSVDFTSIPKVLDSTIEKFDKDSNLRSTKLKTSDTWSRKRQPDLLSKPTTKSLPASDVKSESNEAYDLLDAISRSGSLPLAYSDLHVVVCVTHCFEKDVMATVVQDNVNPIEKLEKSTLLLGSAIHGAEPLELIADESDRARFQSSFPLVIEPDEGVDC